HDDCCCLTRRCRNSIQPPVAMRARSAMRPGSDPTARSCAAQNGTDASSSTRTNGQVLITSVIVDLLLVRRACAGLSPRLRTAADVDRVTTDVASQQRTFAGTGVHGRVVGTVGGPARHCCALTAGPHVQVNALELASRRKAHMPFVARMGLHRAKVAAAESR